MTVGRVVPVLNIIKDRSTNMYRVLITDDEKIEREGIKFLLAQEEGEYEIHEAANGRQALNIFFMIVIKVCFFAKLAEI